MSWWISVSSRPSELEEEIRRVLADGGAMQERTIARQLKADPEEVRAILERWVEAGIVRRLRPVRYEGRDLDFFRLVRPDDSRYEWEQKVLNVGPYRDAAGKRFERLAWSF